MCAGVTIAGALVAPLALSASTRSQDERWTTAGSPYVLSEDKVVPAGSRLVIEPGVEVRAERGVRLIVHGQLNVEGTAADPVTFTVSSSEAERWGGIVLGPSDPWVNNTISGAVVDRAVTGVAVSQTRVNIAESVFRSNLRGIRFANPRGDVSVERSVFENNRTAVTGHTRDVITLYSSDFWNNTTTLLPRPQPMYDCGADAGVWNIHANDILRGPVNSEFFSNDVRTPAGSASSDYEVLATGNWWGTPDENEVYGRMTTEVNCCPAPAQKAILWRPIATVPQTNYQPTGTDPDPEPRGTLHGDPGLVTQVSDPEHGSCRDAHKFRSLQGTAYGALVERGKVTIALRRGTPANCRWWDRHRGQFVRGGCDEQKWFRVEIDDSRHPWKWRYRFPSDLPKGKYMAWSYGFAEPTHLGRNQVAFRLR